VTTCAARREGSRSSLSDVHKSRGQKAESRAKRAHASAAIRVPVDAGIENRHLKPKKKIVSSKEDRLAGAITRRMRCEKSQVALRVERVVRWRQWEEGKLKKKVVMDWQLQKGVNW